MPRRPFTAIDLPAGFVLGGSIDVRAWQSHDIAIDTSSVAYSYLGYREDEQPEHISYYSPSVAARAADGRNSFRFVGLRGGVLFRTSFFREDMPYRLLRDRMVILPTGAKSYFGVVHRSDWSEDLDLTRQLFGGTREDIEGVARALAKLIGRGHHEFANLPRVTFSKQRDNSCDFSNCLIPKEFPYIAFEQAQYAWSHVSLYGFYRLLAFLCENSGRTDARLHRALIETGLEETTLARLIKCGQQTQFPIQAGGLL